MALSITINKVDVAASFSAGTKVADISVSGGTSPYAYELATGGDYFQINGTEVQVKADMNIDNIQSFSVTVTDSTSGTALTATSDVVYPPISAKIQSRFNSANKIYKITKDIDLGHGVLTIPSGCTLDFQGGSFSSGVIVFNDTGIKAGQEYIFINITFLGVLKEALNSYWVGVNTGNNDNSPYLNFLSVDETPITIYFPKGTYTFKTPITLQNYKSLTGQSKNDTVFNYTGTGVLFNVGDQDLNDFSPQTGQGTYYFSMNNITINGSDRSTNIFMQGGIRESQFSDLKIKGFNIVFNLNNSWSLSFERLKITDCDIIISSGQEFNDVTFSSCYFASSLYGFVDFMGQSILFNGCSFQGFTNSVFLPVYQRVPYNKLRLEALAIIGCYIETSGGPFFNLYNYDFKLNGLTITGNTFNMTRTSSPAFYIYNAGINLPSGTISANKFRIYGTNRYPLMHIEGRTNIAVLYNDCTAGVVTGPSGERTYPLWDTNEAQKGHNAITGELKTVQVTDDYTENQGWLNQGSDVFINQEELQQPAWLSQEGIHEILNINITGDATQTGNIEIKAGGSTYTIPIEVGTTQDDIRQIVLRTYYDKYLPSIDNGVIYLSCKWRGPQPSPTISNTIGVSTTINVNRAGTNNRWANAFGQTPHQVKGTSEQRPALNNDEDYGAMFFDSTLGMPIWWNGGTWVYPDGYTVEYPKKGTTAQRPALNVNQVPFQYYDTDLQKFINWNGTAWVNMDGTALS